MRFKAITHGALAYVCAQLLGELWQDGDRATLATFGLRNQDHLLIKKHILSFKVYKFRDVCTSLE